MLSEETIARYRAMTPAERLEVSCRLTEMAWEMLAHLSPEEIQRRLDASAEINDRSNRAMLEYLLAHDR